MSEPNARDYTIALTDVFACLLKELDKAGVIKAGDVLIAMSKEADRRRAQGDTLVADALANIGGIAMVKR
jgi:hypothetical protein